MPRSFSLTPPSLILSLSLLFAAALKLKPETQLKHLVRRPFIFSIFESCYKYRKGTLENALSQSPKKRKEKKADCLRTLY